MVPLALLLFLVFSASVPSTAEELSVGRSLADVWTSFGDLANTMYTVRISPSQGRAHKDNMLMPLLIGMKAGGALMSAVTALKILVLKTLVISKLALLASIALTVKYLYDKMQMPIHEMTPYHHQIAALPVAEQVMNNWQPSYEVQTHTVAHTTQDASTDSQGHYSEPISLTSNSTQGAVYSYSPEIPTTSHTTSQRKYFRPSPVYKSTLHKTTYRI